MTIQENVKEIKKSVSPTIEIIAASKTRSIDEIQEAIKAGINKIGENYVQEAEKKHQQLKGKTKFHLIGHLQSNKVKKAITIFDMIETVDSEKLAKEIDKQSKLINKVIPILIEINSGEEENKSGIPPEETTNLIKKIAPLKNITIKGLMTMAPLTKDPEQTRPYFKKTKQLFENIKKEKIQNVEMKILSMGMSNSYEIAIQEGATQVRIGTKLFGKIKNESG